MKTEDGPAQQIARGRSRVPRALRSARPWLAELLLVSVVLGLTVGGSMSQNHGAGEGHVTVLNNAVMVATCLVLGLRTRAPLCTVALTEAGQALYLVADGPDGPILLPTMVALYTLASRGRLSRSVWIASGVALAHAAIRMLVTDDFFRPEVYLGGIWMYLPVAIGEAVRAKQAYWAEVTARLARAEAEREEEARRRVIEERMRIARELHDVVAHSIAMINIQAGVAAHVIDSDVPHAKQALVHIKEASRDALAELRTTLGVLRQDGESADPKEPTPGAAGLEDLVASYKETGLPVRLTVEGERPLSATVGLALYRIVQESLTNAVKHAGPGASAGVQVTYGREAVVVDVRDDGRGGSAPASGGTGHGLVGMRERAVSVGGTLAVGPRADGGFAVHAVLPIRTEGSSS